jgi:hypothetical protein
MNQEDVDVYNLLSGTKNKVFYQKPSIYFPVLTPIEYNQGYFDRFFLRSSNDGSSPIIEVDELEFRLFLNNPFYIGVQISWKIAGNIDTIKNNNMVYELGVGDHNLRQLNLVEKLLPGISSKLSDIHEFYKAD